MERSMVLFGLERPKLAWLRRLFQKKPVDYSMVLALHEAEKRMDKVHIALNERHMNCIL